MIVCLYRIRFTEFGLQITYPLFPDRVGPVVADTVHIGRDEIAPLFPALDIPFRDQLGIGIGDSYLRNAVIKCHLPS